MPLQLSPLQKLVLVGTIPAPTMNGIVLNGTLIQQKISFQKANSGIIHSS